MSQGAKPLQKKLSQGEKKLTREERLATTIRGKLDKATQRKQLFDKIVGNSVSSDNRALLKASSAIGKKETNKESIERQQLEIKLNVKDVVPKDKYARDTPLDKKKITKAVSDNWDDFEDDDDFKHLLNKSNNGTGGGFVMPKDIINSIAADKKAAQKEAKEERELQGAAEGDLPKKSRGPKAPKKEAIIKKQEATKKKYFFWSKDQQDMDFDEYNDDEEVGRKKSIKQSTTTTTTTGDQNIKLEFENSDSEDSEDENTIQLKGNTGDIKEIEKQKELEKEKKNNNNNNIKETKRKSSPVEQKEVEEEKPTTITTSTTTTPTTTDKKVVKKLKQNNNNIVENNNNNNNSNGTIYTVNETVKTKEEIRDINLEDKLEGDQDEDEKMEESLVKDDQVDRYALTIDDFGKTEEENRVIMLSEQSGLEILEQRIKEDLSRKVDIKYSVFHVQVNRTEEVNQVRDNLPIMMEEHNIIEKVKDNDVVIICGETGSGKTTQVPQFLYESGFGHQESEYFPGLVGVTQPRRVAAVSTAKRVAEELNVEFGKEVGYQIRYDKQIDVETNKIKFMTDGILLREVQGDFLLTKYSCIIIDEAHERNLNTDILIGLLSRIAPMRKRIFLQQQERKKRLEQQQQNGKKKKSKKLDSDMDLDEMIVDENGNTIEIKPLKLIIMSATLRVEDFTNNTTLFNSPPPVINIPTRQFPVTIHFNKKTVLEDYVDEAHKKVVKIHKRLPEGGVLVFVTGRQEVEHLCAKLRRTFPMTRVNKSFKQEMDKLDEQFKDEDLKAGPEENGTSATSSSTVGMAFGDVDDVDTTHDDQTELVDQKINEQVENENHENGKDGNQEGSESKLLKLLRGQQQQKDDLEDMEILSDDEFDDDDEDEQMERDSDEEGMDSDEERAIADIKKKEEKPQRPLYVLPLYSNLPTSRQMRVFQEPPKGSRLVVVATNIAETSLTIPNIKYVVDCGRVKGRFYNKESGVSSFDVTWTSKASADQRAGRAGRTGPGHCYRIYSSAVYANYFEQFSKPEILMVPIDSMVLQMKSMGIENVEKFPFPTPPEQVSLKTAVRTLVYLGALEKETNHVTSIGDQMSKFPVSPRFARMIMLGQQHGCLPFVIAIVAILTVKNPFMVADDVDDEDEENGGSNGASKLPELMLTLEQQEEEESKVQQRLQEEKEKEEKKKKTQRIRNSYRKWVHKESDVLTVLKVVGAYDFQMKKNRHLVEQFCQDQFLNSKSMTEIYKLRMQLTEIINGILDSSSSNDDSDSDNSKLFIDTRQPLRPPTSNQELYLKQVITAGLIDQIARVNQSSLASGESGKFNLVEYTSCISPQPIYLHPLSNLAKSSPEFVVCVDIIETKRPYMKMVTEINPCWLPILGRAMCAEFKPLEQPTPKYSVKRDKVICYVKPSFGHHSWEMPLLAIDHPNLPESCKYFAKALLDGVVMSNLLYLVPFLNTRSNIFILPNTQSKVFNLLTKLKSKSINNKLDLIRVWKDEPSFLLKEYLPWIDDAVHQLVKSMWPPLDTTPVPKILKQSMQDASKEVPIEYLNDNDDNYLQS
ncbi:DEAD/DEAH box helicase [Cavenderia fasciculata]|uniref:RNA helicase n=1 Tax=Cavenderia fasciculata TaxID=261658 RepID=F4PZ64_CACFS|nr:DEAD/DEAH box helicase [Cavenderia fasciculata]EGG19093.1 DEAD/DEAH box helicase [Cavenderia fasciculata]|eukprot:XP_004366726.1 DEAD/DEAH box helicase [Cavenderia fasciculata]